MRAVIALYLDELINTDYEFTEKSITEKNIMVYNISCWCFLIHYTRVINSI